jgi:hypothetical protein
MRPSCLPVLLGGLMAQGKEFCRTSPAWASVLFLYCTMDRRVLEHDVLCAMTCCVPMLQHANMGCMSKYCLLCCRLPNFPPLLVL